MDCDFSLVELIEILQHIDVKSEKAESNAYFFYDIDGIKCITNKPIYY